MSKVFKIAIDAGHGLNTAGKRTPDDEREWSFNNKLAVAFEKEIMKYEHVEVRRYDDRTGKIDVPLRTRTNNANSWGADIYISFHHNANTGRWGNWTGVETFRGSSANSIKLAQLVHPKLVRAYGLRDRGIKTANLHVTRETKMPVILIEGGFMDSTIDIKKLRDGKVLENAGIGIARGVVEYAGLKPKQAPKPKPTPQPIQPTQPQQPKSEGGNRVMNLDSPTYWKIIEDTLQENFNAGILTSYKWVEKAKNRTLTVDECAMLNMAILGRNIERLNNK